MNIYKTIGDNIAHMETVFADCGDMVKRKFPVGEAGSAWLYVTYIDMMADRSVVDGKLLQNLMMTFRQARPMAERAAKELADILRDEAMPTAEVAEAATFEEVCAAILTGDTALFVDGCTKAFVISTKGWPSRSVPETETEVVVQGSKEAFNEVFRVSSALIRRRIRDTNLKLKQFRVGRRSQTDVGLMYLQDVARPEVLRDVEERIRGIDVDAILDSGYIEQLMESSWTSLFPQAQMTERPDKAASAILEGRVVIIVDNSPFALIVPATLSCMTQASEDYYQRWQIMTLTRWIRFAAAFLAVAAPGFYIAAAVYHPSIIPTLLMFKMAGARLSVPFPAVFEILLMDIAFELLREAGVRLPGPIGNTIGIVGGLIIGQAAVEAGLVSPIVVIVVALTGICGFAVPSISLAAGLRLSKYALILASAVFGLFGFWLGLLAVVIHLASLTSFGFPYLYPYAGRGSLDGDEMKDTLMRAPLFTMEKRPMFANPAQCRRMSPHKTARYRSKKGEDGNS